MASTESRRDFCGPRAARAIGSVDDATKGDRNQKEDSDDLHSSLRSGAYSFVGGVRRIERGGQAFFFAIVAGAIPETRMANAG